MTENQVTQARERRAVLAAALASVRRRIDEACVAAGRRPDEVELLAVTKTRPASDVELLLELGQVKFGENRPQEAAKKVAEVAQSHPGRAQWHLIGRLQRNKARSVVRWADMVESVDSARLVETLGAEVRRAMDRGERTTPLPILLQVSLDGDPRRGGVPVDGLLELADKAASTEGLELRGVMAVAPLAQDPDRAFAKLAESAHHMGVYHPHASVISAGMTGDLEQAIRHGSTCVRVGTALLGDRPLASP